MQNSTKSKTKPDINDYPVSAEQHVSNSTLQTREAKERDILKKAIEEKEAVEAEKRKAQKEREVKMRALMEEYKLHDAAVKMKQRQEEKDLKAWEMMQRFKRDEYDKQTNLEERKKQWQQKLEYGNELLKDIVSIDFFKTKSITIESDFSRIICFKLLFLFMWILFLVVTFACMCTSKHNFHTIFSI